MSVKRLGKQGKYGIIRHNKASAAATAFSAIGSTANQWTNPVLAATNFRRLLLTALTPQIDSGVTVDEYNLTSQSGLIQELSNFYIDSNSGIAKFNFSAPADLYTLSALLVMALQQETTTAKGSYYSKVITPGFATGPIDFEAGNGYTFGLCEKIGASADDGTLMQNGIMDTITLTIDFNAKGVGRLVGVSGTMAFKSVAFDQTLSGTFVDTTLLPLGNTDLFVFNTLTSDSVDLSSLCIRRIEITLKNSVTSNCSTTGGAPNQFDCTPEYLINILVDHNSLTEKIRGDFKAGATVALTLTNGLATSALGYFSMTANNCKQIAEPAVYNGDYYGYNLQLRAYQPLASNAIAFTIVDHYTWDYSIIP